MMDRSYYPVRKTTRAEQRPPERWLDPVEARAMKWPLACDAWAMRGKPVDESRLPRHDILSALSAAGAEFLVVEADAIAAHGFPRATGDIDLRVRPAPRNAERIWRTFADWGTSLNDLTFAA